MCANPDKFQITILERDAMPSFAISVQDYTIALNTSIKVLGVTLDDKLQIAKHISNMHMKAPRQISVLKRVPKNLNESCRTRSCSGPYAMQVKTDLGKTGISYIGLYGNRVLSVSINPDTSSECGFSKSLKTCIKTNLF